VVIKYRIDGVLYQAMEPIDKRHHQTIISRIKVMSELDIAEKRVPQDGRFKLRLKGRTIDFRVSVMPTVHGEDCVIRILDKESMNKEFKNLRLDILGFDEETLKKLRKFIREPYGMVLVTGPTGSGKTTTLYACLSEIQSSEDKIITIEDPVEYQLKGITQIPVNEKKGLTFARGLRSILRHDPDKIMVGEIRDEETAQIAIQSALTGHLVFTTVHANNVVDVLGRFLNMKVDLYNFVSALNCVLAQRLVRKICPHCKRPARPAASCSRRAASTRRPTATSPSTRAPAASSATAPASSGGSPSPSSSTSPTHPRAHPGEAAGLRDQARRQGGGDDLPARVGRRAGGPGGHHAHLREINKVTFVPIERAARRASPSAFTDLAAPPTGADREEVLRWKLKRLVPFRVDELRLTAQTVLPLPRQSEEEPYRVLLGFAVESLLTQLEDAFAHAGVRLGRITNASLGLVSAVARQLDDSLSAVALVDGGGYSLIFVRDGEPVLHRFKAFAGSLPEGTRDGFVVRDLRLTRSFLEEQLPGVPVRRALVAAPAGERAAWTERLSRALDAPAAGVGREQLLPLDAAVPRTDWHRLGSMLGAAAREVA
jgi:Tfp pilus assembly pilus retraction ATPase PilT